MKLKYKEDIFINEIDGIKQVDFEKVEELINDSFQESNRNLSIDGKLKKCTINYNFTKSKLTIYELPYIKGSKVKHEVDVNVNGQLAQVDSVWKDIEVPEAIKEEIEEVLDSEGTYISGGGTDI